MLKLWIVLIPALVVHAQIYVYEQCGGQNWTGDTTCVSGSTCMYQNLYYSQCIPSSDASTTTTKTSTKATSTKTSTKTTSTKVTTTKGTTTTTKTASTTTTKVQTTTAILPTSTCNIPATTGSCTIKASGGDDGPALVAAVKSCKTVTIPCGTTLSIQSAMDMTGLKNVDIVLNGNIKFTNTDQDYWKASAFQINFQDMVSFWQLGGTNISLTGGGTIDGNGAAFWSHSIRPIILRTYMANGLTVRGINMINSPEWFNIVESSNNVLFDLINLNAPAGSPNTDGWDTYRSDTVSITNSVIYNGDDCVAFKPNSSNILLSNLTCYNSHGISVGSLGQYSGIYDIVENVTATDISLHNTENGARIKAWAGSGVGSGIVNNVTFHNLNMDNVKNALIIDQCYETSASDCDADPSNVIIQNIVFNGFTGTSSSKDVASLDCSPGSRCSSITVENISTIYGKTPSESVYECENTSLLGNSASLFGSCSST
ncbi:hypothetical protein VKT23_009722 [Stygiomarasmius scandens]|uniref:galacturonan 1,4-alpha-galacturonidase n=1 Tax=Marasmiellus scandens TaxID=2682957 RepID=A0ABR1JFX5_9AGAR